MKKALFILIVMSLFLGACGATTTAEEPTPALTGEDIQETAVAMAWTMAAQTMEAMPTATFTPLPPTATFTPAFTPTPVPTITPIFTATPVPTATQEGGISICKWEGAATKLVFFNDTKATATISLYLSTNNKGYGDCYILVPVLQKNGSVSISAPVNGYYYVFAWMASDKRNWSVEGGISVNNPDKHEIRLTENGIKFIGP